MILETLDFESSQSMNRYQRNHLQLDHISLQLFPQQFLKIADSIPLGSIHPYPISFTKFYKNIVEKKLRWKIQSWKATVILFNFIISLSNSRFFQLHFLARYHAVQNIGIKPDLTCSKFFILLNSFSAADSNSGSSEVSPSEFTNAAMESPKAVRQATNMKALNIRLNQGSIDGINRIKFKNSDQGLTVRRALN